jgi:uncharacterized protein
MNTIKAVAPISPAERATSLDVLRGFAVLGILIMNIQSYAMIGAAYINPTAYGDLSGLNKWVWILSHIFGDQKFMTLFSIMFGAGIVMMSGRAEEKERSAAGLHYRRIFWLFVIGMVHAYLLWYGDILVTYAICAVFVFLLRKLPPRKLLIIGFIVIAVPSLLYWFFGWSMQFWPPENVGEMMAAWKPGAEAIAKEIAAYQGGWPEQMAQRAPTALWFQTFLFLIFQGWRAGGLMLVGMALLKWGVVTAQRPPRFYRTMLAAGFVIGVPVVIYGVTRNFAAGWALDYSMFFGFQYNYWGSLFIASAYIGLVMLICQANPLEKFTRPFTAVGRTALSNYLLQTLICTTIFYGHGFGLFGKVERAGQALIVLAIWIVQLIVSPIWLRHFRFGPAEWLWRSLTYWKIQPLRNQA